MHGLRAHADINGGHKSLIRILYLVILTEALVELFFKAAPLQEIRTWLIKKTPWLRCADQGHLLECKYCSSIWIAACVLPLAMLLDKPGARLIAGIVIIARLSNYTHILYSVLRDAQINMRLKR